MMHGWQSEPTDRPESGCDFWNGCNGRLTHNHNCRMQCGVAKCYVILVVVVVESSCC